MAKKRISAVVLLIIFVGVIIGSSLFIIEHSRHDCDGDDCPVCAELSVCHRVLKSLGNAVTAGAAVIALISCFIDKSAPVYLHRQDHSTLISLKVELLN